MVNASSTQLCNKHNHSRSDPFTSAESRHINGKHLLHTSTSHVVSPATPGRDQPTSTVYWPFCFNSFRVLKPRKPAWILVAAAWTACCLFLTKKPRMPAWIFVADFSLSASWVFCLFKRDSFVCDWFCCCCRSCCWSCWSGCCVWRQRCVDSFNCLRTRYPRKFAWIFVAAVLAFIALASSFEFCDMNDALRLWSREAPCLDSDSRSSPSDKLEDWSRRNSTFSAIAYKNPFPKGKRVRGSSVSCLQRSIPRVVIIWSFSVCL